MVFVRILITIIIFSGLGILAIDYIFDSGIIAAIRQFFVWIWRVLAQFFANVFALVSQPTAAWLKKMTRKFIVRKAFQFIFRFITPIIIGIIIGIFGEVQYRLWVKTLDEKKKSFIEKVTNTINNDYFALLPNWVRIIIAVGIIVGVIKLFFIIQSYAGPGYAFVFSIIAGFVIEKLPLIGFDKLLAFIVTTSAPIRKFGARYQWIRWLWLGPLLDTFTNVMEEKGRRSHKKREKKKMDTFVTIITDPRFDDGVIEIIKDPTNT